MPRPTHRISALHPFSHQARQSLDDSSLPNAPHPPSPPSDPAATAAIGTSSPLPSNSHRYSAIPLISSVAEPGPNEESESFSYTNNLNTGVYNSLSRIPSYRLPSPVSLPSRHNSRIQRDRGMSVSPVSSISATDAPITSRYSYLIQPVSRVPQSPSPPDMPLPPLPPSQDSQVSQAPATMGVPFNVDFHNLGHPSRPMGPLLTPINESTPNLAGSSSHQLPLQEVGHVVQDRATPAPVITYSLPSQHAAVNANDAMPAPTRPRNAFQRMNDFAGRQFSSIQSSLSYTRRPSRPLSISQFVRRHRPSSAHHPPTPALAIIGLVTSTLVFIALMTFIWVSPFAGNIVAVVYAFSVFSACLYVLVRYNQKKRRSRLDVERGGSRLSLFGRSGAGSRIRNSDEAGGAQPEMDMVQESEIIVIPRMPVHRVVGEGEADPELPPYSRGNAAEIMDIPVPPPANA
ncbi:hypothetical protein H072_7673 [Dactylellina haptotyla CBS 200.50]|uniref:Uncharacterized protein n=1 Tax=Dactylellina haptotyla (strain CBS 200.50) TaxID=1284197 RepID=S8A6U3_DACHA|nr:hypothetical protein H072_7673 [Dactylellina haptotyla CBS 200.50]